MRLGKRIAGAVLAVAAVATAALAVVSCAAGLFSGAGHPARGGPSSPARAAGPARSPGATPSATSPPGQAAWKKVAGQRVCMHGCHYVGVALSTPTDLSSFVSATRVHPQIVQIYEAFGSSFPLGWASGLARNQMPLIQVNPYHAPLAAIAAGQYDSYLHSYAASLRQFHHPVALSFAHEMNGAWYPWGCHRTSAADFIAAYRHVVQVIRHAGAHNVIWVWTTNVEAHGDCPIHSRYPGDRYVTWVGVDGYMRKQGRTFANIFAQSLAQIGQFTHRPILLSETGVLVGVPGDAGRIRDLYRGAATTPGIIGVVYFDAQTKKYGDYRPQDNQQTLAAFRRAVRRYVHGH